MLPSCLSNEFWFIRQLNTYNLELIKKCLNQDNLDLPDTQDFTSKTFNFSLFILILK